MISLYGFAGDWIITVTFLKQRLARHPSPLFTQAKEPPLSPRRITSSSSLFECLALFFLRRFEGLRDNSQGLGDQLKDCSVCTRVIFFFSRVL